MVACATGFAVIFTQLDDRAPVLALAEPVTVGQLLTPADLREVRVAADADVAVVPSSQAASVAGSTMALSVPAGTLLSPAMLGAAAQPEPGEAVVAVALAPGQFPPEVFPGAHVTVVPAPTDPGGDPAAAAVGPASGWDATVVGVHPTTTDATTVISLQVHDDDAGEVAAAGPVSVVMTSTGGE